MPEARDQYIFSMISVTSPGPRGETLDTALPGYISLIISSPADGRVDSFQFRIISSKTAMITCAQTFAYIYVHSFWLNVLCLSVDLTLNKTVESFPKLIALFSLPSAGRENSTCSTP